MTAPALRTHSFLGAVARPHFAAVSRLAAEAVGYDAVALDEPGLPHLDEVIAAPGPALLFLCGLPYVRLHDRGDHVEAIAGAVPDGEPGPRYFADLVVRAGLEAGSPADLVGRRIGMNGRDSLSGYVLPYAALSSRGLAAPLYERAIVTGSHRRSLRLLVAGEIDAAAIDSTVLELGGQARPRRGGARGGRAVRPGSDPAGGAGGRGGGDCRGLREAFVGLSATATGREALALGLIERYAPVDDVDYDDVRAMDAATPA